MDSAVSEASKVGYENLVHGGVGRYGSVYEYAREPGDPARKGE